MWAREHRAAGTHRLSVERAPIDAPRRHRQWHHRRCTYLDELLKRTELRDLHYGRRGVTEHPALDFEERSDVRRIRNVCRHPDDVPPSRAFMSQDMFEPPESVPCLFAKSPGASKSAFGSLLGAHGPTLERYRTLAAVSVTTTSSDRALIQSDEDQSSAIRSVCVMAVLGCVVAFPYMFANAKENCKRLWRGTDASSGRESFRASDLNTIDCLAFLARVRGSPDAHRPPSTAAA